MRRKSLLLTFIAVIGLVACQSSQHSSLNTSQVAIASELQHDFTQARLNGVLTLYDGQQLRCYGSNVARAKQAYIPASTFKILNALIGLQYHKTTIDEIFIWHGEARDMRIWQQDMTLTDAMQLSNFPVFQQLARRIGQKLMQSEVQRVGYGNQQIGDRVDRFWLDGPLTISPEQEAKFIYQLAQQHLPFSKKVQQQVTNMLLLEQKQGYRLYAKTGWGLQAKVGWFTGWVEQPDGQIYAFSLNIEMQPQTDPALRKQLTLHSLQKLKLYPI